LVVGGEDGMILEPLRGRSSGEALADAAATDGTSRSSFSTRRLSAAVVRPVIFLIQERVVVEDLSDAIAAAAEASAC
jgi:hypothetical protein